MNNLSFIIFKPEIRLFGLSKNYKYSKSEVHI